MYVVSQQYPILSVMCQLEPKNLVKIYLNVFMWFYSEGVKRIVSQQTLQHIRGVKERWNNSGFDVL